MTKTNGDRVTIREVYQLVGSSKNELKADISALRTEVTSNYITKTEFEPVRKIVYGLVGLILVSVSAAIIKLVIIP